MSARFDLASRPVAALVLPLSLALLLPLAVTGCSQSSPDVDLAADDRTLVASQLAIPPDDELHRRLDEAIAITARRTLVAESNAAWQVVHGILAFGPDLNVIVNGKEMSAQEYLLGGGHLKGWVLSPGDKGVETLTEPGSKTGQGHEDQWLGYLSLSGLKPDTPVKVGDKTYKVIDLLSQAQWDIYPGMEATWTLMALASYMPMDVKWKNKRGEDWTIDRVVQMEAEQDIAASACGGTHRLVGLTVAVKRHMKAGGTLEGGWKTAHEKIYGGKDPQGLPVPGFILKAKQFQQPDGSFSANYFQRASATADIGERIGTTGHTLEFLALAMSDDELKQAWVARAVVCLCDLIEQTQDFPLECGGLYHASRGLMVYRQRRFGDGKSTSQPESKSPASSPVAEATATQR